jgi:hypothetical protein
VCSRRAARGWIGKSIHYARIDFQFEIGVSFVKYLLSKGGVAVSCKIRYLALADCAGPFFALQEPIKQPTLYLENN